MSTLRPCAATPCPHGAARLRVGWALAVLFLLVPPFAGFVTPGTVLAHHTNIKLPFASGATWRVLQGYNGSSHQNNSSTWQYYYSLDLVRVDGNTAGQRVLSAVNGTIRWIDTSYGGMSINLGDGYAFAYFHTYLAPGLAAGQTVTQGQYLGTIAGPGDAGNGGTPHIHVTLWSTNDGGNWDRHAIPFTGDHKLNGYDFPDKGGSNQYVNTQVVSTNSELVASGGGSPPAIPSLSSPATGTTFTTSPTTATLRWNAVSGATQYQVVINDGDLTSPWQSATSWTTPSLGNGQYSWQVRAKSASGTSNLSTKWVFWVDGGTTSPPPTPTPPGGSTQLAMRFDTSSGRVGTTVNASGTGYGANETIRLYIDSVSSAHQLAQTKANASGSWSTSFTVPDAIGGDHGIFGRGMTTDKRARRTFTVTPFLNRTPYQGTPGTTINLTVQGFGGSENVKVSFDTTSGPVLANVKTNALGTGTTSFPMPLGSNGWHDYVGVGGTSGLTAWGALYVQQVLRLDPKSGAPGTTLTAGARGFPANQTITFSWNKVAGGNGTTLCTGKTNSNGNYNCTFAIPQAGAGSYPLVATAGGISATVNVGVSGPAAVSISPSSGPVSGNIAVTAGGFGAGETVNFSWDNSTSVWQARQTDGNGAVGFPALVPSLGTGSHTLKAKGATSGKSASAAFTVVAGNPGNTSMTGPGTFAVTATEEDLIGGTTSNGHKILPADHFVSLPACTQSSCPWLTPGGSSYVAACGSNCYVRVTNPANNKCSVAPVYDVGPWFTNDNWWDPTNQRNLNKLSTTKNTLPQGYTGADAARDGLDVGYGVTKDSKGNPIGTSNVGYQVGNRAAIDLGDGTWFDIGFFDGQGIGQVVVTILWLTGEDHTAAAAACGQSSTSTRGISLSPTSGKVGSSVAVAGTGFKSGETVDVYLDSTQSTALASATASSTGGFNVSIKMPDAKGGNHTIYAKGRTSGGTASATFKVNPSLIRSPSSGTLGTKISVSAKGFAANESLQLRWRVTTGTILATLTTDAKGSARGSFLIPKSTAGGTNRFYGIGQTSGLQASTTVVVSDPTVATVSLSPVTGSPRSTVTANGAHFSVGEAIDLYWDASTTSGGSAAANTAGGVSLSASVPLMPAGSHTVKLKGRTSGKTATATYTVVQSLELAPTSGAGGTTVTVKGRGWAANTTVNVYWNRNATKSGTRVCTVTSSATGTFTCTFKAPDSPTATYPVMGVAGSSTATANFRLTGPSAASLAVGDGSGVTADASPTPSVTGTPTEQPTASESTTPTPTETPTETATSTETPTETPIATEPATTTPAPTETATPSEDGTLALSPNRGPAGTEVTVTGSGFGADEQVDIYFHSTDSEPLGTVQTDADGAFTGTVVIPDASAGNDRIVARGQTSGQTAAKTFRVTRPRRDQDATPTEEPAAAPAPDTSEQPAEATATEIPTEEPTPTAEPVPQELVFRPVADASVSAPNRDGTPTADGASGLAAGGADNAVAFVTFQIEGVAAGSVVSAQLVLTNVGEAGAAGGTIGALADVWADPAWTYETAPVAGVPPAVAADGSAVVAPWLDPWAETAIDVTGTVAADGTVTFVIFGTSDARLVLGSSGSDAAPRLVVTVLTSPAE
ncbi:MAG TPA: IPT/TIG domain-containing protein [Thermomicrobiales bacterium]